MADPVAPVFKLGLKVAGPKPQLSFGTYFKAAKLPPVPTRFGRPWLVQTWGVFGNDIAGDCVWAGAAHETMMFSADVGSSVLFDTQEVLSDYSAVTGYVYGDDSTDQGTDMTEAAAYRQKTGIIDADGQRHKIDVYASLRNGDLGQLKLAAYLLGAVGVGVNFPDTAMDQFNNGDVWDIEASSKNAGGHYIPCIGRNSVGNFLFVTWGRLQAATPAWVRQYMNGGIAYLSRERLSARGLSPQGFNLAQLNDDFAQITKS